MGRSASRSRSRRRDSRSRSRGRGRYPKGGTRGEDKNRGGRQTGVVVSWLDEKGFGFIKPDRGGEDVFTHISGLKDGDALRAGDPVDFEENYDERRQKYRAECVTGCVTRRKERRRDSRSRSRSRGRGRRY